MAIYRLGGTELDFRVIGAGVRDGLLAPPFEAWGLSTKMQNLGPREMSDLMAFRAAGWSISPKTDPNWEAVKARNPEPVRPGLLARHPSGSLVILRNRLVLKLSSGTDSANRARLSERYARVEKLDFGDRLYAVELRLPNHDLEDVIRRELDVLLSGQSPIGPVAYAEPSILYHFTRPGRLIREGSHDARLNGFALSGAGGPVTLDFDQWHWKTIRLEEAWAAAPKLGEGIRVGVIDLGFHRKEPQIRENVAWTAYVDGNGKVFGNKPISPDQHGTFCAGLIGAIRDSSSVNGAAPKCKMALVALPSTGVFSQEALGSAISLCTAGSGGKQGVDVISCSLGLSENELVLQEPLKEAIDLSVTKGRGGLGTSVVWAVFNVNKEIKPLSLESHRPLLCVGQTDSSDNKVSSGFGDGLDLLAPGAGVPGIVWGSNGSVIAQLGGSSLAAPCVAGVAALVLSANPNLSSEQVAEVICRSCDPIGPQPVPNQIVGWGRLNAKKAVERALE